MILMNSLDTFAYPKASTVHLNSLDFVRDAVFEPESRFFLQKTISLGGCQLGPE